MSTALTPPQTGGSGTKGTKPFSMATWNICCRRGTYGDDRAANSGFDIVAHINNIPTNRSLVSTSSDFTTCNLYMESLEELFVAAREYVAKERAPTPDKPDPAYLLHMELDAQCKQFDLIMKQNSTLLAAMAKGNGGGGGG
jgi:hypothetical protein